MAQIYINNVLVQTTDVTTDQMLDMVRADETNATRRPYTKDGVYVVPFGRKGFTSYTLREDGMCVRKVWAQGLLRQVFTSFDPDGSAE